MMGSMRLLVLSDVHADAAALERILEDARPQGWEELLFLGDAVGYGEEPERTVELLREQPLRAGLIGNHEVMMRSLMEGKSLEVAPSIVARLAAHASALSTASHAFLAGLEEKRLEAGWGAVHGAPRKRFEYLISVPVARANVEHMERDVYFVGHTHVPTAFLQEPDGRWRVVPFRSGQRSVQVPPGGRAFFNPGSSSLPRDGLPGGSYGLYDEEERIFTVVRF